MERQFLVSDSGALWTMAGMHTRSILETYRLPLRAPLRTRALVLGLLLSVQAMPALAQDDGPDLKAARRLIEREKYEQAEDALEKVVADHPGAGAAWYLLGAARHGSKDYGGAILANERAATFPSMRASALYNRACAKALSGQAAAAKDSLEEAVQAGFLDWDLIASDPDLASIRADLVLPVSRDFEELRGRNGVVVPYLVQLPGDFDPQRPTPALVTFAPGGHGPLAASWSIEHFWGDAASEQGWILVHLVAPEKGWFTHPSHHALEDLLKKIQKDYEIAGGKFHLFGMCAGARPALTYAGMSRRYFEAIHLASADAWSRWDDSDLKDFRRMPVHQFVGSEDGLARSEMERVGVLFEKYGVQHSSTVVPDAGPLLEGLSGSAILAQIHARTPGARD